MCFPPVGCGNWRHAAQSEHSVRSGGGVRIDLWNRSVISDRHQPEITSKVDSYFAINYCHVPQRMLSASGIDSLDSSSLAGLINNINIDICKWLRYATEIDRHGYRKSSNYLF